MTKHDLIEWVFIGITVFIGVVASIALLEKDE